VAHSPESDRYEVDVSALAIDDVKMRVVGDRAICLKRIARGYGALDNRCPYQGGPFLLRWPSRAGLRWSRYGPQDAGSELAGRGTPAYRPG
jgi:hypothetical protein